MRFDWYQGTIQDDPRVVLDTMAKLGHEVRRNDRVGKMYRYTNGFEVHHNEHGVVASIACGGNGDENSAHAWATSDSAEEFANLVRDQWPDRHLVTRIDAAQDFVDPNAFRKLRRVGRRIARDKSMKFPMVADPLNPQAGRTQYIGSPTSEYRARIYEKGWEVYQKGLSALRGRFVPDPDSVRIEVPSLGVTCSPSDWVRCELQARPKDEDARRKAAMATPEQVWSFTEWAQEFARDALALDLERFYIRQRKLTTDERALRWMCRQYANVLHRTMGDLGDWACVGLQIGEILDQIEKKD